MSSSAGLLAGTPESVDTLVIGGGQAGLATSYWLTQAGVEHLVVERRNRFGGGWLDRWDSFCLVAPNFVILLPGMPYTGPDPDGFMARDEVVNYLQEYAPTPGHLNSTPAPGIEVSATYLPFPPAAADKRRRSWALVRARLNGLPSPPSVLIDG